MRAALIALTAGAIAWSAAEAQAATKLTPAEIQSTFFTGQPFTASTPSNVAFKMTFNPDGKVTREPTGKSGVKGEGTWKLDKNGFCTTWKGSKASCFTVTTEDSKKWSVLRGSQTVATWTK
jgi:hypothetical protein